MNNKLTQEQKDHFSSERSHWCVVKYTRATPWYYAGYFGAYQGQQELRPAFTIDFNNALKMHSRIAADEVLYNLKRHAPESVNDCKVEDHMWFASTEESNCAELPG